MEGSCAFVDPGCEGGLRFEPNAGGDLGGTCVVVDAGTPEVSCGGPGEACCASGPACGAGATCAGATCAACALDVGLGRRFACALARDHHVWCSGDNSKGQLGIGLAGVATATPAQVSIAATPIDDATAVTAGRDHACVLRTGGTVWCWGSNANGEIGNGATGGVVTTPAQVTKAGSVALTGITSIAIGDRFSCGLETTGALWCWGSNLKGQLGDGTLTSRNVASPVLVAAGGAALTGVVELTVGGEHMCIRKAANDVWCWGENSDGQVGDGTKVDRSVPAMIATASSVSAGRFHTCFVNADTTVSCLGWSGFSRLGIGGNLTGYSDGDYVTAQQVKTEAGTPFTGALKVIAGAVTCAVNSDSSLACWGDSHYGQTGLGQGTTFPLPLAFAGAPLEHVDRVVTHFTTACAHRTTDAWLCWGRNSEGALGDGTFANHGLPTPLELGCP